VRLHRTFVGIILMGFVVYTVVVGLAQVTVANHENSDFGPSDRPARLPRGRDCWVLPRAVDPPHDHIFRPYVALYSVCSRGLEHRWQAPRRSLYTPARRSFSAITT
jgi:hypothetical protein